MQRLLSFFLTVFLAATAVAQPAPMKWGDIPDEHLRMTDFPADTNAAAVILAEFGETYFDENFVQTFRFHRRVKLLRESAYEDFGTIKLRYNTGRRGARIDDLRAQTITPGADGKPVVHKVDRKSIFKERIGEDLEQLSFTFPALQPGAIIEFSYKLEKPQYHVQIEPWLFQSSEPVLHSEYRFEFPGELQYVVSAVGQTFDRLLVNESERATRPGGSFSRNRWVMENVPALRAEPFMTTPRDYRMAIRFQLSGIHVRGWGREGYLDSWPAVAERFMARDGVYGQHLDSPGRDVKAAAEEAVGGATAPLERMKRIYDYVRTRIDFNEMGGFYAERAPKDVLKDRTGNSPEINLLVVAMMREAGLKAYPALLSTRDHGMPNTGYPILSQFNDMIAAVEIGSQHYLLDATDEKRPYDILPYNSLNGEAWMVRHPDPLWVPIDVAHRLTQERTVAMEVSEEGQVTGHVSASNTGYAALFTRHDLEETTDHTDFTRTEIFDDLAGLTLSNVVLTNPEDVTEPVTVEADFALDAYAQVAGDFLYLSPILLDRADENPLKNPERTFPVDMGYGRDLVYTATITIPEGFVVSEVPSDKQFGIQGGGALYKRTIEAEGRTLQVRNRFTIAKTVFQPNQYEALRGFYERAVAAAAEQIVLQRAPAEATSGE